MSTAAPSHTEPITWALDALGLPPDATTKAVRSAIVEQLEEADLSPPPIVIEVIEILAPYAAGDSSNPQHRSVIPQVRVPPAAFYRHCERQLREEVEAFAKQFFELPVSERQATWARLAEQAQPFPAVMLRLQALRPALDLIPPKIAFEEHQALADVCMQLFVMRPAMRAAARNALMAQRTDKYWVRSALRFYKWYPQWAALAPDLFEALKKRRLPPEPLLPKTVMPMVLPKAVPSKKVPPVVVQTNASPQFRGLMGWFIAMMITGMIALLFIGSNERHANRRSNPPRLPTYRVPELEMQDESDSYRKFPEQLRQKLREYGAEKRRDEEPVPAPPPDDSPMVPETIDLPPQP